MGRPGGQRLSRLAGRGFARRGGCRGVRGLRRRGRAAFPRGLARLYGLCGVCRGLRGPVGVGRRLRRRGRRGALRALRRSAGLVLYRLHSLGGLADRITPARLCRPGLLGLLCSLRRFRRLGCRLRCVPGQSLCGLPRLRFCRRLAGLQGFGGGFPVGQRLACLRRNGRIC